MTRDDEQDDVDALSILQMDAYERARDFEESGKVFRAVESLTDLFGRASQEKFRLHDPAAVIEQLRRLAQMVEDYYAAHPSA